MLLFFIVNVCIPLVDSKSGTNHFGRPRNLKSPPHIPEQEKVHERQFALKSQGKIDMPPARPTRNTAQASILATSALFAEDVRSDASSRASSGGAATGTASTTGYMTERRKQLALNGEPTASNASSANSFQISSLPISTLRKYKSAYKLQISPSSSSLSTYIGPLASLGSNGASGGGLVKSGVTRTNKEDLANGVKRHFSNLNVKENDVIVHFLYSVKNHERVFRLRFPPT